MQTGQGLVRADLDQHGGVLDNDPTDQIHVMHRAGHVGHQVGTDLFRVGHIIVSHHAEHRYVGPADGEADERLFQGLARVFHDRSVERAGNGQEPGLERLAHNHGGEVLDDLPLAGHDRLIRSVVVGNEQGPAVALGQLGDHLRRGGGGQHSAAGRGGQLDRIAAGSGNPNRLFEVPNASGHQGHVLSVAVTEDHAGPDPAIAQRGQHDPIGQEDRGLCEPDIGADWRRFVPGHLGERQVAEASHYRIGFAHRGGRRGNGGHQLTQHSAVLGALAGKDERDSRRPRAKLTVEDPLLFQDGPDRRTGGLLGCRL